MKKTVLWIIFSLLLSFLVVPVSAQSPFIFDSGNEFTEDQLSQLSRKAEAFSREADCGIYYLSIPQLDALGYGNDFPQALGSFYIEKGLGTGADRRGILLGHTVDTDKYCIYTVGRSRQICKGSSWDTLVSGILKAQQQDGSFGAVDAYLDLCSNLLPLPQTAAPELVLDEAGILTEEELKELNVMAAAAQEETGCGVYVYIVEDFKKMTFYNTSYLNSMVESLYDHRGYGTTDDHNGVLLFLSMAERDYDLYFHGYCDSAILSRGKDHIEASFLDDFRKDSWYNGLEDYVSTAQDCIQRSLDGHPYNKIDYHREEHFAGILVCTAIGLGAACLLRSHFVKQLNTVQTKTQAAGFTSGEGLQLSVRDDEYNYTSTHRIYSPPSSSGSSRSGGGRSGGGGSHRSGKF